MQTDLSKYNNSWYRPAGKLKIVLWIIVNFCFINNSLSIINSIKISLLRLFGASIGSNVLIKPSVNIKYPWFLEIGDNVWIGENVWIDNLIKVTIGNNVCISQGAMLLSGNHNYKSVTFDLILGQVILEDGAWVGAKAIVCPGVTMCSHSILSVGSVATKDLDPYSIYQGNPATKVRGRVIL